MQHLIFQKQACLPLPQEDEAAAESTARQSAAISPSTHVDKRLLLSPPLMKRCGGGGGEGRGHGIGQLQSLPLMGWNVKLNLTVCAREEEEVVAEHLHPSSPARFKCLSLLCCPLLQGPGSLIYVTGGSEGAWTSASKSISSYQSSAPCSVPCDNKNSSATRTRVRLELHEPPLWIPAWSSSPSSPPPRLAEPFAVSQQEGRQTPHRSPLATWC